MKNLSEEDKQKIVECMGLWLAEGDKKTQSELTFTNNCFDLILFFQENVEKIYTGSNKPRLYVYSPGERILFTKLGGFKKVNNYRDERANRPYYIYKLADVNFIKHWKCLVEEIITKKEFYQFLVSGIFAGEGNIYYDKKSHKRTVRISAKTPVKLINAILNYFEIKYTFVWSNRMYELWSRDLDKIDKIKLTELHPEKSAAFKKMMKSRIEIHYPHHELKRLVYSELGKNPRTNKELSELFRRSHVRILEVLTELRNENKISYLRNKNGNQKTIWMLKEKKEELVNLDKRDILSALNIKNITKIGKLSGLSRKAVSKRFKRYEEEGLIEKDGNWWRLTKMGLKILGIDESGREFL